MILPNQVCLIVKLYNNRPELLPDSNDLANQIDLFYKEEQKLVEEISKRRCQLSITPNNVKTILKEYRKKVESQGCKITETSNTVKRFL